jgi:hypothetical protein
LLKVALNTINQIKSSYIKLVSKTVLKRNVYCPWKLMTRHSLCLFNTQIEKGNSLIDWIDCWYSFTYQFYIRLCWWPLRQVLYIVICIKYLIPLWIISI